MDVWLQRHSLVLASFSALWSTRFEDSRELAEQAGRPVDLIAVEESASAAASSSSSSSSSAGLLVHIGEQDAALAGVSKAAETELEDFHSITDAICHTLCWARMLEAEVATIVALLDEQDASVERGLAQLSIAGSAAQAWEQAAVDTLRLVKANADSIPTAPAAAYGSVLDGSFSGGNGKVARLGQGLRRFGWGSSSPKPTLAAAAQNGPRKARNVQREIKCLSNSRLFARILQAEATLLSAGLHFRKSSMLKGAFSIRAAWKQYESCLKEASKLAARFPRHDDQTNNDGTQTQVVGEGRLFNDVQNCLDFGTGLFYFFISLVPTKFLWVVEAIGFQADRNRGISLLRKCWEDRGPRAPLALLLVIWIERFFIKDLKSAEALLRTSSEVYPTGAFFTYLDGYTKRQRGDLVSAAQCFENVRGWALLPVGSGASNPERPSTMVQCAQLGLCALYEFGWCKFLQMEWASASAAFAEFLENQKGASFRAFCGYQLGMCYLFLNQPQLALEVFDRVPGWVRKYYSFDAFAGRKSTAYAHELRRRSKKGDANSNIDSVELDLVAIDICLEAHNISGASSIYNDKLAPVFESSRNEYSSEYRVQYYFAKGRLHRINAESIADMSVAIAAFGAVVDLDSAVKEEHYVIPHALCELGEIYYEVLRDVNRARDAVAAAKKFGDFDFDKPLIRRMENLLDRIRDSPDGPVDYDPFSTHSGPGDDQTSSEEFFSCDSDGIGDALSELKQPLRAPANTSGAGGGFSSATNESEDAFACSDSSDSETDETHARHRMPWDSLELLSLDDVLNSVAGHGLASQNRARSHWARHKRAWLRAMDELIQRARASRKHGGVRIKDRRHHLKLYSKCFVGKEFVDWLCANSFPPDNSKPICATRQDAVSFGQRMLEEHLFHHVAASQPFADELFFYRFHDDLGRKELNMGRVWALPVRPATVVADELNKQIHDMFSSFLSSDGRSINLIELQRSKEFRKFCLATSELQRIDLFTLSSSQKLCFFLNCYNMLMIHGNAVYGVPTDSLGERLSGRYFFDKCCYQIGGSTYSLNDIEHGILRGNSAAPGQFLMKTRPFSPGEADARIYHVFSQRDPRIHFALNCGARSCPPLRLFLPETVDGALTWATESFLDEDIDIDYQKRVISVSKLFDWYSVDFGSSLSDTMLFIATYCMRVRELILRETVRAGMSVSSDNFKPGVDALLKRFKVKYKDYDWTTIMSLSRDGRQSDSTVGESSHSDDGSDDGQTSIIERRGSRTSIASA